MAGKVFYLCDGNVSGCNKKYCYKKTNDDPCRHTSDISHAINFKKNHKRGPYVEKEKSTVQKDIQPMLEL